MMKRLVAIVVGLLVIALVGCNNPLVSEDEESEDNGDPEEQVESVSLEPEGGTYNVDIGVTLSSETEAATIYYTTDGSEPDEDSAEYTDPIEVAGDGSETTIKAIAVADGYSDRSIAEAAFSIDYDYSVEQPDLEGNDQPDYRTMIRVPGGTFTQEDTSGNSFEHTISDFDMAQYAVTYELWYTVREWAKVNGYTFQNEGREGGKDSESDPNVEEPTDRRHEPVTRVSWYDIVVWANAYSEMAGLDRVYYLDSEHTERATDATEEPDIENEWVDWDADGYRLPTEGEWQYAASYRDGSDWTPPDWPSGGNDAYDGDNENNEEVAWFDDNSNTGDGRKTQPVGEKEANELGIYDMSGNVWEWTWDWGGNYPEGPETDYCGPDGGSRRFVRGGSLYYSAYSLQVGRRGSYFFSPSSTSRSLGFRLVRTP